MRLHVLFALLLAALMAALSAPALQADDEKKPAEEPKTVEVKAGRLTLKIPETWKSSPPSNRLRLAQFAIPLAKDDEGVAELTVTQAGGGIDPNITRWVNQFQAEGRKQKFTEGSFGEDGRYVFVDLSGTYNATIGPPIEQKTKPTPGSRMLGVIMVSETTGVYFLKMTGPDKTVAAQAKALRATFGGNAEKEKEYKLGGKDDE